MPRRHDHNGRFDEAALWAENVAEGYTDADLARLDPANLPTWIAMLKRAETKIRQLRKRLEALRDDTIRACAREGCGHPVTGRADAQYCSDRCRIYAHRLKAVK